MYVLYFIKKHSEKISILISELIIVFLGVSMGNSCDAEREMSSQKVRLKRDLITLKEQLILDSTRLHDIHKGFKYEQQRIDVFQRMIMGFDSLNLDLVRAIIRDSKPTSFKYFRGNSGFNVLVNDGSFSLIQSDELRKQLSFYYDDLLNANGDNFNLKEMNEDRFILNTDRKSLDPTSIGYNDCDKCFFKVDEELKKSVDDRNSLLFGSLLHITIIIKNISQMITLIDCEIDRACINA